MSAVLLAAAIALPAEGEPDVAAMRAFVATFEGPWPLAANSHPCGSLRGQGGSDDGTAG